MSEQQELPLFLTGSDLLPPVLFRYALTDRIFYFNAMNSVHFCSIMLRSNQMHYLSKT